MKSSSLPGIPVARITEKIYLIRGHRVMLDQDLASLYQVETKALKQAVKRNIERFPYDFRLTLSREEFDDLRSQIVTSSWSGTRYAAAICFCRYAKFQQPVTILSGQGPPGCCNPCGLCCKHGLTPSVLFFTHTAFRLFARTGRACSSRLPPVVRTAPPSLSALAYIAPILPRPHPLPQRVIGNPHKNISATVTGSDTMGC